MENNSRDKQSRCIYHCDNSRTVRAQDYIAAASVRAGFAPLACKQYGYPSKLNNVKQFAHQQVQKRKQN